MPRYELLTKYIIKMNIEELKKIVRGNGFQYIHGSTTIVIDVETVIDLLDDLKQCDIPVVVQKGTLCECNKAGLRGETLCNYCIEMMETTEF